MVRNFVFLKITLFLIIGSLHSQNTQIKYIKKVSYVDSIYNPKASFRQRMPRKIIEQSNRVLKKYTYTLSINDNIGEFKINQTPNSRIDIIATKIKGQGVFYKDLLTKEELNSFNYKNKNYIVNKPFYNLDWQIIKNETKDILKIKCFKAIAYRKLKKGKSEKIIAWYTEKIPKSFGPSAYANLPGVILFLEVNSYFLKHRYKCVFEAISIEENKKKIVKPVGILVTKEELKSITSN